MSSLPSLPPLAPLAPLPSLPPLTPKAVVVPPHFQECPPPARTAIYTGCPPARVLAVDPPWSFDDATPHKGAEDHYSTLTVDEIKAFPLPPIADNAILFLWRVGGGSNKGSLGEDAYAVARAWGFTPKSELTWIKTLLCKACGAKGWAPIKHPSEAIRDACSELQVWCDACHGRGYKIAIGMGRYVRGSHEICLIATRGKGMIPEDKSVRSVFFAPRREHSSKPDRFYEIVRKLYPDGPYVELFARRRREGWYQYGDELPAVGATSDAAIASDTAAENLDK